MLNPTQQKEEQQSIKNYKAQHAGNGPPGCVHQSVNYSPCERPQYTTRLRNLESSSRLSSSRVIINSALSDPSVQPLEKIHVDTQLWHFSVSMLLGSRAHHLWRSSADRCENSKAYGKVWNFCKSVFFFLPLYLI